MAAEKHSEEKRSDVVGFAEGQMAMTGPGCDKPIIGTTGMSTCNTALIVNTATGNTCSFHAYADSDVRTSIRGIAQFLDIDIEKTREPKSDKQLEKEVKQAIKKMPEGTGLEVTIIPGRWSKTRYQKIHAAVWKNFLLIYPEKQEKSLLQNIHLTKKSKDAFMTHARVR